MSSAFKLNLDTYLHIVIRTCVLIFHLEFREDDFADFAHRHADANLTLDVHRVIWVAGRYQLPRGGRQLQAIIRGTSYDKKVTNKYNKEISEAVTFLAISNRKTKYYKSNSSQERNRGTDNQCS